MAFHPHYEYKHNQENSAKQFTWFAKMWTEGRARKAKNESDMDIDVDPKVGKIKDGDDLIPLYYFSLQLDREKESAIKSQADLQPTSTTFRVAKIVLAASPYEENSFINTLSRGKEQDYFAAVATTRNKDGDGIIPMKVYYFLNIIVTSYNIEYSHCNTEEMGFIHAHIAWEEMHFVAKPVDEDKPSGTIATNISSRTYKIGKDKTPGGFF